MMNKKERDVKVERVGFGKRKREKKLTSKILSKLSGMH